MAYDAEHFNPKKLIEEFDKIAGKKVDEKGRVTYENDYFGPKSIKKYQEEAAKKFPYDEVVRISKSQAENFLNIARDPNVSGHMKTREEYQNRFKSSSANVHDHFLTLNTIRNRVPGYEKGMPSQNAHHERRMLTPPRDRSGSPRTADDDNNSRILKSVMAAKWRAVGYGENQGYPADEFFVNDFYTNYCGMKVE